MVVRRNFEELYRVEEDPWQIGSADARRYEIYLQTLERLKPAGGFASALDLGCGKGAFTARLAGLARSVTGVEISDIAVSKARSAHPDICFIQGDARRLSAMRFAGGSFDLVVCSDLIAYFSPPEAELLLGEVKRILTPSGRFFFAPWCPRGTN